MIKVTPQEFDFIRASIKSAYPTFNVMPDQYSIRMWYRMLGDLDYKLCETALMELFATKNKYIAQLTTHENAAIEQQHRDQIAEEPERATPEYIDMLMREHGFKR